MRAEDLGAEWPIKRANLKNAFVKRSGTYKKVPLHMRRRCEGGLSKRANLAGKISSACRKQIFQSGDTSGLGIGIGLGISIGIALVIQLSKVLFPLKPGSRISQTVGDHRR